MRILIGLTEICGLVGQYAEALRREGHEVTTVMAHKNQWYPYPYTVDLVGKTPLSHDPFLLGYLMGSHDVFIYLWARSTMLPDHQDLKILRQLNKKIISIFVGSDVRDVSAYKQWFSVVKPYLSEMPWTKEGLEATLRPLRMAERYCNVIISQPNQSLLGIRPYHHFFVPVEASKIRYNVPERQVPVVCHIPARSGMKGTKYFMQAIDNLRAEGIPFELRLKENVPHAELLEEFANADVVIDELFCPLYGKTTLEALAAGCAVASADYPELEAYPPNRPIWRMDPDKLTDQLRVLLTDRELRIRLAREGRIFIEKYHLETNVVRDIMRVLEGDVTALPMHYPDFYVSGYEKPDHEVIVPDLLTITAEIAAEWGISPKTDFADLTSRGLWPVGATDFTRWSEEPSRPNETSATPFSSSGLL